MEQCENKIWTIVAEGLCACGVSQDCATCVMYMLETDEHAQAMLDWILELNEPPSEQDVLLQALNIKR